MAQTSTMLYPPHHTTLSHITKDNWREHAAKKKQSVLDAIPSEWKFDASKYDDRSNILSVPEETGLLSSQELEITDIDDATQVRSFAQASAQGGRKISVEWPRRH